MKRTLLSLADELDLRTTIAILLVLVYSRACETAAQDSTSKYQMKASRLAGTVSVCY